MPAFPRAILLLLLLATPTLQAQDSFEDFLKNYNNTANQKDRTESIFNKINDPRIPPFLLSFLTGELGKIIKNEFVIIEQLITKVTISHYQLSLPLLSTSTLSSHTHSIGWFLPWVSLSFISGMHIIIPFGTPVKKTEYNDLVLFKEIADNLINPNQYTFTIPTYILFFALKFRIKKTISRKLNKWQFIVSFGANSIKFLENINSTAINATALSSATIKSRSSQVGIGAQYFIIEKGIFSSSVGLNINYITHNFLFEYPFYFDNINIESKINYKTENNIYISQGEISWMGALDLKWFKPFFNVGAIVTIISDIKKITTLEYSITTVSRMPNITFSKKLKDYTILSKNPIITPVINFGFNVLYSVNISVGFSMLRTKNFIDGTYINAGLNLDL